MSNELYCEECGKAIKSEEYEDNDGLCNNCWDARLDPIEYLDDEDSGWVDEEEE